MMSKRIASQGPMTLEPQAVTKVWFHRASAGLVIAAIIYYLAILLYVTLSRIRYPFSLEMGEGESMVQVQRILSGLPLYDRPGYTYVAEIYPPLYYYVGAAFVHAFGPGFFSLRLISLISTAGCIAAIYLICRRCSTRILPAALASGLFAAAFPLGGYWFDIARVDMLAAFLVLVSIYLLCTRSTASYAIAGVALALGCLTKQTHLLSMILLSIYVILFDRRRCPAFIFSLVITFGLGSLILNRIYAGWFSFFIYTSPFGSGTSPSVTLSMVIRSIPDFWVNSILRPLPIAAAFILVWLGLALKRREVRGALALTIFAALGMLGTSWANYTHLGGYQNDLIPALCIICVLFGRSAQTILYDQELRLMQETLLLGMCFAQFAIMGYPLAPQIPTARDLSAGQSLLTELSSLPGAVYVPFHPELALMAGKPTFASWLATSQLEGNFGGGNVRETARVKTEFANAMARREFSVIILDQTPNWIWGHPEKFYSVSPEPIFSSPDVFWPVTGWAIRPTIMMVPITE